MKQQQYQQRIRVNDYIRAEEVRVVTEDGENLGVLKTSEALKMAKSQELDLIEISPNAKPPIAKIADYGKFLYEQKKKQKVQKAKTHIVEVKVVQVKIGTDDNDLSIKAKKISKWLKEGHRIKVDLFLPGRTKYMDKEFLKGRIDRILKLITEEYKIAQEPNKSPKGMSMLIEKK